MANVSTPLKDPLPSDARDMENIQRSIGNVRADRGLLGGSVCRHISSMAAPWETTTTRSPVDAVAAALSGYK
jgi:hypothetical protein